MTRKDEDEDYGLVVRGTRVQTVKFDGVYRDRYSGIARQPERSWKCYRRSQARHPRRDHHFPTSFAEVAEGKKELIQQHPVVQEEIEPDETFELRALEVKYGVWIDLVPEHEYEDLYPNCVCCYLDDCTCDYIWTDIYDDCDDDWPDVYDLYREVDRPADHGYNLWMDEAEAYDREMELEMERRRKEEEDEYYGFGVRLDVRERLRFFREWMQRRTAEPPPGRRWGGECWWYLKRGRATPKRSWKTYCASQYRVAA